MAKMAGIEIVKTKDDNEMLQEIAALAKGVRAFRFVKLLKEYFTPTEIVLILRAARDAGIRETGK